METPSNEHLHLVLPGRRLRARSSAGLVALLTSYRKLNWAQFAVLAEIEADLPVPVFTREREAYRATGAGRYRTLSAVFLP